MESPEDEELSRIRNLVAAEQSGDHETLGKANAEFLRTVSNASGGDENENMSKNGSKPIPKIMSSNGTKSIKSGKPSAFSTSQSRVQSVDNARNQNVAKLLKQKRHKKPIVVSPDISVMFLAKTLCPERKNAALIRDDVSGKIIGIITDADICKRVVGKGKDSAKVKVGEVMTPNPISVGPETDILEIFDIMCKRRFRHLPVLDDQKETVYGLVDIAQCLYDAIQRIEKAQSKEVDFMHTVQRAHMRWNSEQHGVTAVLAQEIINDMMQRICPKVSVILSKSEAQTSLLPASATVQQAVEAMAIHSKTAVLGVHGDRSRKDFGIFTTKDLLSKVVAKGLDPRSVTLDEVMTKNPDTIELESSLLEALHVMHDGRFLHVPVVTVDSSSEAETVVGILDVLDCAVHTLSRLTNARPEDEHEEHHGLYDAKANPEAEKEMFTALFLRDDLSEGSAERSAFNMSSAGNNVVNINDSISQGGVRSAVEQPHFALNSNGTESLPRHLSIKIRSGNDGTTKRTELQIAGQLKFEKLRARVVKVMYGDVDPVASGVALSYLDEDNDEISLRSDNDVQSALTLIQTSKAEKLIIIVRKAESKDETRQMMIIGGAVAAGVALLGAIFLMARKSGDSYQPPARGSYYR